MIADRSSTAGRTPAGALGGVATGPVPSRGPVRWRARPRSRTDRAVRRIVEGLLRLLRVDRIRRSDDQFARAHRINPDAYAGRGDWADQYLSTPTTRSTT